MKHRFQHTFKTAAVLTVCAFVLTPALLYVFGYFAQDATVTTVSTAVAAEVPTTAAQQTAPTEGAPSGDTDSDNIATDTLTEAGYQELIEQLTATVDEQGPKVAMGQLEQLVAARPTVTRICHGLAHEIGHETLEQSGSVQAALAYQSDFCGSGYMHGIIEKSFEDMTDVPTEMLTICSGLESGSCYHGVGHGLMLYVYNDLPQALTLCDAFTSSEARARCYEGVFMENFNPSSQQKVSPFRDEHAPLFPCADQHTQYKGACYFYAPRYYLAQHEGAYADMLDICLTAEEHFRASCARGVGSALAKQNIGMASLFESVCTSADPSQTNSCIDGVVSYTMVNFDGSEEATVLCGEFSGDLAGVCRASVESRSSLFAD